MHATAEATRQLVRMRGRSYVAFVFTPEIPIVGWLAEIDATLARSPGFFVGKPVVLDLSALDLSRADNEHIAFGTGPHGCLGQHIARIEIDAMLVEVLTRMDGFELAAPPQWLASNFISGPKTMPLKFRPGRRLG